MVFKPLLTKHEVRTVVAELRRVLQKAGIPIDRLILFGSYARGTPHPWSDIDLCVVSSQFGRRDYDDFVKISRLAKRVNYLIEAHPMHPKALTQEDHPLAGEIKQTGKRM